MPKAKILLVDDQPANLLALEAILDGFGENLVKAHSGEEALCLADEEVAVVLLDVQMHGLDGFDTAKLLRRGEKTRHTPILFLTAYDHDRLLVEKAYALGAVDYLVKPLVPAILRSKVAVFVELFKKTQEIAQQAEQLRQLERQELEQRFASLIESSNDAIISKSLDGIIQSWNGAAERLFGYTAKQAIGRSITMLFPPDRADEENRIIARLRAGEPVEHFDTVRLRSDGRPIDVSLTISPIKDATGRIVGASKIARDITDRKLLEAELQEADRRKDEFLAMLAHELRNPLAPICNALQIIKLKTGDGPDLHSASQTLERQVGQMVGMVDDLLDVSRIRRGKIEIRRRRIELASAVRHAVEAARSLFHCMEHELTVALPPQPVYLNADPTRLAQIVGNLLNNACKFTNRGGRIALTVQVASRGSEPPEAIIRVRDNGIGIAADQLHRIFEMFTQVDTSLERSAGGLGIGLALVKNLVEMHGGTVEVHSAGVGQGCEFVVRLPILVESSDLPAQAPIVGAPTKATARRILVVDDNQDSAASLSLLLKMSGNEMHTAHDGVKAVEAAATHRPDVVLLDIGLPVLNGYDACRRIREQPWGKDMVLIALTGWGQDEERRKSKEAGFNGHLVKPVDLAALQAMMDMPPDLTK